MKRQLTALLGALALAAFLVPVAAADAPEREVLPAGTDFVTESCGFPVLIETEGETHVLTFRDDSGGIVRQLLTFPGAKQTLTNLDSGESVRIVVPGPGVFEPGPDGSRAFTGNGPWSWYQHPLTGDPGIFLTQGRWVISRDAAGNRSFEIVGRIVDLCAELA